MKNLYLLAFLLSLPTLAHSQNLLNCQTTQADPQGNVMSRSQCALQSFAAVTASFEDGVYDAIYTVTISSSCGRSNAQFPVQFNVGNTPGSKQTIFLGQANQTFSAQGTGPLTMVDTNPALTNSRRVPGECDITLQSISFRPTSATLQLWREEARSSASRLGLYAGVFEKKAEISAFAEVYISSAGTDQELAGSVLETIKSQLAADDPNVQVIDTILTNASIISVNDVYSRISSTLSDFLKVAKLVQTKLLFGQGREDEVLQAAITRAETILNN